MNLFSEHVAKYACSCGCPEVELLEPSDMIVDRLNEMSRMLDEVRATASSEKSDAPVKTQSETIILKAAAQNPVLPLIGLISKFAPNVIPDPELTPDQQAEDYRILSEALKSHTPAAPVLDVSNTISEKRPLSSVESELKAKLESMVDSRMA